MGGHSARHEVTCSIIMWCPDVHEMTLRLNALNAACRPKGGSRHDGFLSHHTFGDIMGQSPEAVQTPVDTG